MASLNASFALFDAPLLPRFREGLLLEEAETAFMQLWSEDAADFVANKVTQQGRYEAELRELFTAAMEHDEHIGMSENEAPEGSSIGATV